LLGVSPSGRDWQRLQMNPKEAMAKLFAERHKAYTPRTITAVTAGKDASSLRETEPVQTILRYIEDLAAVASESSVG
jgi:hypothetical protein